MQTTGLGLLFLIGLIIAGVISGFCLYCTIGKVIIKDFTTNKGEYSSCSKSEILLGWSVSIVIFAIFAWICYNTFVTGYHLEYSWKFNIYALEDGSTIKGSRYYIEEQNRYFYMSDYKEGKKKYSVETNKSYIVEDADEKPEIIVFEPVADKKTWFASWVLQSNDSLREYRIVVPKKTVTTNFNVDLKN
jgi:hypothetical protein